MTREPGKEISSRSQARVRQKDMSTFSFEAPDALIEVIATRAAELVAERQARAPEPWVGVREAAVHLGCGRQRIYDLVHRKDESRIPHRKEGGRLLFKLSLLDRWVENGGGESRRRGAMR
jgi:excisionase family DNA binding protein